MESSFLFFFSVKFRLCMLSLWLIRAVCCLRSLVILRLPSYTHVSVIHMPVDPWHTNHTAGSFILWPHPHPLLGSYSVPSLVSRAPLCSATSRFRIIFCRILGVLPVVYVSSRSSSGVAANLVRPWILFPVPPLPVLRLPTTFLYILWVILA